MAIGSSLRLPLVITNGPNIASGEAADDAAACTEERCQAICVAQLARHLRVSVSGQQDDRVLWLAQSLFRCPADLGQLTSGFQVRHHHGKRLFNPAFSLAQERDSKRIGCVHGEMKSTQPFHGQHQAGLQGRRGFRDGIGGQSLFPRWSQSWTCGPHCQQAFGCA